MAKSLFPEEMMRSGELNLDTIAAKLTYFHEQLHLLHWQTKSYAEHKTLGKIYEFVQDFKDDVVEKIMGYTGKRPGIYKIEALSAADSTSVVAALMDFAINLKKYGEVNSFHDISNLADALCGEAAKTKYLLTLS